MSNLFNVLVCVLALLTGVLIGDRIRKHRKDREPKDRFPKF